MSAIRDDIETYESLCEHFGEKVQYRHSGPDCYGEHAKSLKKRYDKEREQTRKEPAGPQTRFDRKDPV